MITSSLSSSRKQLNPARRPRLSGYKHSPSVRLFSNVELPVECELVESFEDILARHLDPMTLEEDLHMFLIGLEAWGIFEPGQYRVFEIGHGVLCGWFS